MKVLNFKDFMKKYNLKNDTMNESELQRVLSYYFDSFGGQPDKFLLNQAPKPIMYHNYKTQDINSRICGSYYYTFSF